MGMAQHLPFPEAVPHCPSDSTRALFPHSFMGVGDSKRFYSDVTFLLVLPQEGVVGERVYGLAIVWVHPY